MVNKVLIELLRQMLRIRIVEERIADIYPLGEIRTPTHFSIGQEAVSVGVCHSLRKEDAVFASHRSHAAYLAKAGDLPMMLAELFGRRKGACGGRSGSAHLASPRRNMYSAPIVGAMIPVAVGAALSFLMDKKQNISVAFFGDAALEEGVFAESVNFAVVKRLPVLFVCENNFFSTHTHIRYRQPLIPIYKRARALGIDSWQVDGNDVLKVKALASRCIERIRRDKRPIFIECVTYRYREHVGPRFDLDNPYRSKQELKRWMGRCPIKRLKKRLIEGKIISPQAIEAMEGKIHGEFERALSFARHAPWPKKKDLLTHVY